jgi:hypothetical protein
MSLSSCKNFTYGGDPSANPTDETRYYTGDTVKAVALLDDAEIAFSLTRNPNTKLAAAECLMVLSARFARAASIKVGDVSKDLTTASKAFADRARDLRADAGTVLPFFGGQTKSGKLALNRDVDAVQPNFELGDWDNPEAAQPVGNGNPLWGLDDG